MDGSQKWKILRLHVEDGIPLASLARETGVGERTLSRWHSLYQTGGISALERAQRADAGVRRTAPELVAFVEHLALTKPRPSIATLHRLAATEAARRGVSTPSYATVRSIVRALDPGMVTLALEGPASYRDRHELVFRHRAEEPNALWQVDHTELDILIKDPSGRPSRPWLTTVMDDYSRAICGYMVFEGAPSAMNTALALRQAIWPKSDPAWPMCGIPDVLYVDHGSDFTSHHLEYTAIALRIRIIHSPYGHAIWADACDRVFSARCIVQCMLTIASRLDVMNRLGRALADPTRSRIILTLLDHPAYPAELARDLDLTRPNVSNHLACLRDCGIVVSEPEGRRTRYEIADSHLAQALTALVDATLAVDEDAPCIDPACSLPGCDAAGEGA